MGATAFNEIKSKTPQETNPTIKRYVECVVKNVTKEALDQTGVRQWEVIVFRDTSANAFALPGGKIGVHTGMLEIARTEAQLAAVLGHEVGHVIARHGAERVSQNILAQTGLLTASALLEKSENRNLVLGSLAIGTKFGVLLPFSRTHESEADQIGQKLMAQAGYDPSESVELWRNMQAASKGAPPEFLSTHPSNQSRIVDLQGFLKETSSIFQQAQSQGKRPACR